VPPARRIGAFAIKPDEGVELAHQRFALCFDILRRRVVVG